MSVEALIDLECDLIDAVLDRTLPAHARVRFQRQLADIRRQLDLLGEAM